MSIWENASAAKETAGAKALRSVIFNEEQRISCVWSGMSKEESRKGKVQRDNKNREQTLKGLVVHCKTLFSTRVTWEPLQVSGIST